jgi:uncharacterized protein (UPF0332 family)
MTFLKAKSEFNLESAKELVKLNYYAPSVHCAYYGSFQFMKHTLKKVKNTTYENIENECKNYDGGTHGYIIDNILNELRNKIKNNTDFANIKRIIKDLKAFRIKSDYFNNQILFEDADKSIKFSEQVISTIKKHT